MCKPGLWRLAWTLAAQITGLVLLTAACTPVEAPHAVLENTPVPALRVAGWYVQDAASAHFQPCNAPEALTVISGEELRKRAADFGLQEGEPIYVRLGGARAGGSFRLASVEQFGSAVPITNCRMSGTMIQQ